MFDRQKLKILETKYLVISLPLKHLQMVLYIMAINIKMMKTL